MKFFFPCLLLCLCGTTLTAQQALALLEASPTETSSTTAAALPEDRFLPAFPAGTTLQKFLATEVDYPELAVDYAIEGTVVLEVEVDASGKVKYLRTVRPLFAPLDEAAVAAVKKMPRLLPAVEKGRAVTRKMIIPFKFSLR